MVTLTPYYRAAAKNQEIDISVELYESHYTEEGWLARKALAVPSFVIAIVIKTTYHVAMAVIVGAPKFLDRDSKRFEAELCNAARDLEEAFACVLVIFNDNKRGSYHLDRSQFFKEKNITWAVEDQPFTQPPIMPSPKPKTSEPSQKKPPLFQLDPDVSPLTPHHPSLPPFIMHPSPPPTQIPNRPFFQLDPNAAPLIPQFPQLDPYIEGPSLQAPPSSPNRTPTRFPPSSYLTPPRSHPSPQQTHQTRLTPAVINLIKQAREYDTPSRMPPTLRKRYAQHLMRELAKVNQTLSTPIRLADNLGSRVLGTPSVAPSKKPPPPLLDVANVGHKDTLPKRPPSFLAGIQGFKRANLKTAGDEEKPQDTRSGILAGIKGFDPNRLKKPKPKTTSHGPKSDNPLSQILARRTSIASPSSTPRRAVDPGTALTQALLTQAALMTQTITALREEEDSDSGDDWSTSGLLKSPQIGASPKRHRRRNSDPGTPKRPPMSSALLQAIQSNPTAKRSETSAHPHRESFRNAAPKKPTTLQGELAARIQRPRNPTTTQRPAMSGALLKAIQSNPTAKRLETSAHPHRDSSRKAAPKKPTTLQDELAARTQRQRGPTTTQHAGTPTTSSKEEKEEEDLSGLSMVERRKRQLGFK